ncbi:pilin [Photobacterium phosphoreum]|uniref:pilin n=1 Tax=Photobacterium phosphoreum TaxID=659 RepID=UPI000D186F7A|nr:prepilin-type N-terminal cleavage/methylation domain-containing protein [Photobacterium phosphoreum]PSU38666.1 pilin [Photobacterium phosphoreum]
MNKQQGFTLIELMIVVAVIGVLSAIAIPAYQDYVKKGALGSALATATAMKTPVEQYIADEGKFPNNTDTGISKPDFSLGTITLARTDETQNGSIAVALNKTSATGAIVTWAKTDGLWNCEVTGENLDGITLTGCDSATKNPSDARSTF